MNICRRWEFALHNWKDGKETCDCTFLSKKNCPPVVFFDQISDIYHFFMN